MNHIVSSAGRFDLDRRAALRAVAGAGGALLVLRQLAAAQDATPAVTIPRSEHALTNSWLWNLDLYGEPDAQVGTLYVDGTYVEYDPELGLGLGAWVPIDESSANLFVVFEELGRPWSATLGPLAMLEPDYEPAMFTFKRGYVAVRQILRLDESGTSVMASGPLQAVAENGTDLFVGPFTRSGTLLADSE